MSNPADQPEREDYTEHREEGVAPGADRESPGLPRQLAELAQAEAALRKSENMLSTILNSVPQSIFWKDGRGIYLGCNEVFARMAGLEHPEDVVGKTDYDLPLPREEAEGYRADDREVMATGRPKRHIIEPVQLADGTRIWADTTKIPLQDANGEVFGVLGVFDDITARKRAEERLQESEEKYRTLFTLEPEALLLFAIDTLQILDANDAAVQMYGYSREELLTRDIVSLSAEPEASRESIRIAAVEGAAHIPLRYHRRKDGSTIPMEVTARVFTLQGKKVMFAILRGLSGQRQAEEALLESEEKYRTLFSLEPDALLLFDIDRLKALDANEATVQLYGYSRDELLALANILTLSAEPEATRAGIHTALIKGWVYAPLRYHRRKDGTVFPVEVVARAFLLHERRVLFTVIRDISERTRAEEALLESEEKYRTLFTLEPDALLLFDSGTLQILDANEAAGQMYGYTREELLGQEITMISAEPEATRASIRSAAITGETHIPLRYHQRRDGTVFPVELRGRFFTLHGRRVVFSVLRDISERTRTEEALLESEEKYRTLFAVEPDALFLLDVDTLRILDANDAALQMYGYAREALLAMTVLELSAEPEATLASVRSKQIGGELTRVTLRYHRRKDGSAFPVEVFSRAFTQRGKKMLFSSVRDITARLRAEETIRHERAYLASAIELLPFPILFITPGHEVIRQNRAGAELLHGQDGHRWWGIQLVDPRTHTPLPLEDWPMMRALRGETVPSTEWLMVLPDGREMPVLLQSAPVFIGKEFVAVVMAFQDITMVKEADRAKDQFLMVLSHELKTPLTSIIGWAQMAKGAADTVPEALAAILHSAGEQQALLERLLILSRIMTGKLVLRYQTFDLWELLHQVGACYQTCAQDRQQTLVLAILAQGLPITGDRKLLERVFTELLDNAITFTGAGGTITITGQQTDGHVLVAVQDTGQGIPPAQLPALLKPFRQLQREEIKGGMGIGLALVHDIIEAHEGTVEIASGGVGQGTTVRVILPLQPAGES